MKNKGFSLIELVVVIAILAIIAGLLVTSPALLNGRRVRSSADNLSSVINKARTDSTGKDELTLSLKKEADGRVVAEAHQVVNVVPGNAPDKKFEPRLTSEVCGDDIEFYYSPNLDGSNLSPLSVNQRIEFSFNRSTGAISGVGGIPPVQFIKLSKGSYSRIVKIYKETGKVVIE